MTLTELHTQHGIHSANQHEIVLQILCVLNKLDPRPSSGSCGEESVKDRSLLEKLSDQVDDRQVTTELLEEALSHLVGVVG